MRNWSLRKRLSVGISAAVAVVGVAAFGVVNFIGSSPNPVSTGAPMVIVATPTEDWKAAEERAYTQQWVGDKLPAYACNGKSEVADFTKYADLRFCPDYTATIELKGRKASDVPVTLQAADGMIKIQPVHWAEWVTGSDTQGKRIWMEGWYFEVTYDPSVIPAGSNQKYNYTYENHGKMTSWTGPTGYGWAETRESYPDATILVEIYAVSKDLTVVGIPIDPVKDPARS